MAIGKPLKVGSFNPVIINVQRVSVTDYQVSIKTPALVGHSGAYVQAVHIQTLN
jgi:hypothetical protein